MAFIPALQGIRVAVEQTLFGRPVINVLTFDCGETPDPVIVEAYADSVLGFWAASVMAYLSEDIQLTRVVATGMNSQAAFQHISIPDETTVGGVASQSASANVAVCVSLRTNLIGRSQRGRLFLGGIPLASITDNQFNNTPRVALQGEFQAAIDTGFGTIPEFAWVVTSYQTNNTPRTEAQQLAIATATIDTRIDTQRRRLG